MYDIKLDPGKTILIFPLISVTIDYQVIDIVKKRWEKVHTAKKIVPTSIFIKDTKDVYNEETAFNTTQRWLRSMQLRLQRDRQKQLSLTFNEAVWLFDIYNIRYYRYCAMD